MATRFREGISRALRNLLRSSTSVNPDVQRVLLLYCWNNQWNRADRRHSEEDVVNAYRTILDDLLSSTEFCPEARVEHAQHILTAYLAARPHGAAQFLGPHLISREVQL
jgi:hypothetical protein